MSIHIPDDPPIAAIESGGNSQSPGFLVKPKLFKYEVVQGFFIQNGPEPKYMEFEDMLQRSFGLIDTSPERWNNLRRDVAKLQAQATDGVQYKVFFLGRHGQGWHNFGASKYGVDPWEEKWTFLNGDGEITWGPDPDLTPLGVSQARAIQACWKSQLPFNPPIKASEMHWLVSPLTRTGQTLLESWGELLGGTPEIWEDWREIYGSHTCDKRSSKSVIQSKFPLFTIEPGFAEEDELWTPDHRESDLSMQIRSQRALDRIFGSNGLSETYISITAHSAIFRNTLAVLRHQPYPLATGEMIPVVVRAIPVSESS
ncbi:histidine phosphatase superfamily [Naematelia encephala]|uniref:Histidine phosphatase superfamily n=1 Tax=Naematelia encephala TaxID=71784 RepID=A0A1Y2AJ36_9TREE|nr:histidine phosphatase superfamily [Naematelia encephala]